MHDLQKLVSRELVYFGMCQLFQETVCRLPVPLAGPWFKKSETTFPQIYTNKIYTDIHGAQFIRGINLREIVRSKLNIGAGEIVNYTNRE